MKRTVLLLMLTMIAAAAAPYPRDLREWIAIAQPSKADAAGFEEWSRQANYSRYEWRTSLENGLVVAELTDEPLVEANALRPAFVPTAETLTRADAIAKVADGWIVAFNAGEFGAAVYWFSETGQDSYKISDHQVVQFFPSDDGLLAIEGLAHLTMSEGSVITIRSSGTPPRWSATTVVRLPYAPYTAVQTRTGWLLVVLSDALVSVGPKGAITTLVPNAPWATFYPNSSVLSPDGGILYVGMRQYVAEVTLASKKIRWLIPNETFLEAKY